MGWMPTTLEISVWHSFWSAERRQQTGHDPSMKHALLDFHVGYWGTMVMAIFFSWTWCTCHVCDGSKLFANSAVVFSGQVIKLYTNALGPWSKWVIGIAAATTMFSTTICCLDAFPRVIREALVMMNPKWASKRDMIYIVALIFVAVVTTVIIGCFVAKLKALVDFATTLAFLTTPIFAYLNLRVVTSDHMPEGTKPSMTMLVFSWVCLFALTVFACGFVYWRFFLS